MKKLALFALLIAAPLFAEQKTPAPKPSALKTVAALVTSKYGKIAGGLVSAAAVAGAAWFGWTKIKEQQTKTAKN